MILRTLIIALVASLIGSAAWAQAQRTIDGTIVRVRASQNTITILGDASRERHTYQLPEGTRVMINGKERSIRGLRVNDIVTITFRSTDAGRVATVVRVPEPQEPVIAEEPMPVELPKTASWLPTLFGSGLSLLGFGLILRRVRKARA